jgi:hypothetical protein
MDLVGEVCRDFAVRVPCVGRWWSGDVTILKNLRQIIGWKIYSALHIMYSSFYAQH